MRRREVTERMNERIMFKLSVWRCGEPGDEWIIASMAVVKKWEAKDWGGKRETREEWMQPVGTMNFLPESWEAFKAMCGNQIEIEENEREVRYAIHAERNQ